MLDRSVRDFLDDVASPGPSTTGGPVCAVTAAAAAGLVVMAARISTMDECAAEAESLRTQATELADADSAAYQEVLRAQRRSTSDPGRADALRDALVAAAEPPRRIAEVSARIAAVAARVAERGSRALRGDAACAAELAAATARSAAALGRVNLSGAGAAPDGAAEAAAAQARSAADAALAAVG